MSVSEGSSIEDVQVWLKENKFSDIAGKLKRADGGRLLSYTFEDLDTILQDRQCALDLFKSLHMRQLSSLPNGLSAADLLDHYMMETLRFELKSNWDKGPNGDRILHTVCAYGNDILNINGGFIFIGVPTYPDSGVPIRPVRGIWPQLVDEWVLDIRSWVKQTVLGPDGQPYTPQIVAEQVDDKHVIVVWCPPSEVKPLTSLESLSGGEAGRRLIYVRTSTATTVANLRQEADLRRTTAQAYDAQISALATIDNLDRDLLDRYLNTIESNLKNSSFQHQLIVCNFARLQHFALKPTNLGLLFLAQNHNVFLRTAHIQFTIFNADRQTVRSQSFTGPLNSQVYHVIENIFANKVHSGDPLPRLAVMEAVVNAVFHRGYEDCFQPIKINLRPHQLEVISYPGPHSSISREHFLTGEVPPVPNRNQYIGEVLRSLRMAEARQTGIGNILRHMSNYGSTPEFDFDDDRSYFRVVLPSKLSVELNDRIRAIKDTVEGYQQLKHIIEQESGSKQYNDDFLLLMKRTLMHPHMLEQFFSKAKLEEVERSHTEYAQRLEQARALASARNHFDADACYKEVADKFKYKMYSSPEVLYDWCYVKTDITYRNRGDSALCRSLFTEVFDLLNVIESLPAPEPFQKRVLEYRKNVERWSQNTKVTVNVNPPNTLGLYVPPHARPY